MQNQQQLWQRSQLLNDCQDTRGELPAVNQHAVYLAFRTPASASDFSKGSPSAFSSQVFRSCNLEACTQSTGLHGPTTMDVPLPHSGQLWTVQVSYS